MKIRSVGAGRRDGQADITKLTVALRSLMNAPNNIMELTGSEVCVTVLLHGGCTTSNTLSYPPPPMGQQPPVGPGLLLIEASPLPADTPQSVGLLWTSDQPDGVTYT
jgi:hypothetical protein